MMNDISDTKFQKETHNNKSNLHDRILNFAVNTLKLLMKLPNKKETYVIRYQLSKSVTAIGANFEEAQSSGDREFLHKLRIALKEANETKYWFKILNRLKTIDNENFRSLKQESLEISLILGSIVSKIARKQP